MLMIEKSVVLVNFGIRISESLNAKINILLFIKTFYFIFKSQKTLFIAFL